MNSRIYAHINPKEKGFLERLYGSDPTVRGKEQARRVGQSNVPQDTILAKIRPEDIATLKDLGGSGDRDPDTGYLHFGDENGDAGNGTEGSTSTGEDGGGFGGSDSGTTTEDAGKSTYNEEVGDLGTSGRGGNVGGISGPSTTTSGSVGGFGSQEAANEAVSNYESDPGSWNAANNDYNWGTQDQMSAFDAWASRNGFLSQVGAGQKGSLDDVRSFSQDNPAMMAAIQMGLTAFNPFAGLAFGVINSGLNGKGGSAIGSTLGSFLGGGLGGIAGSYLGGQFDSKGMSLGSALGAGVGYGLNSAGFNFGGLMNSALGNDRNSLSSAVTQGLGNYAQNNAIGMGVGGFNSAFNGTNGNNNTASSGQGQGSSDGGFNLFGGIGNNNGSSFNLAGGLVGGGLSALGASLLSGNNNMATTSNSLVGDLGGFGAALYGQYGDHLSGNLQTIAGQSDPTQYNKLLSESYTNPQSVYDSQYRPMDQQFYGDMMANESAQGRTTDAYKNGLAREAQFQNYLTQYRGGLDKSATSRLAPYNTLMTAAAANTQGLKNTTANALSKLFGSSGAQGAVGGGLNSLFSSAGTGISNAAGAGYNYLANLFSGSGADQNPSAGNNYVQFPYPGGAVGDTDWAALAGGNDPSNYVQQDVPAYGYDNPFLNGDWTNYGTSNYTTQPAYDGGIGYTDTSNYVTQDQPSYSDSNNFLNGLWG